MSDLYLKFVNTPVGKSVAQSVGLPSPVQLERWQRMDQPFIEGHVLLGAGKEPKALAVLGRLIKHSAATLHFPAGADTLAASRSLASSHNAYEVDLGRIPEQQRFKALIFDASGLTDTRELRAVYDFFKPSIRQLARCGRVLVIGTDPANCTTPAQAATQKALEGFVRSVGKEIGKRGSTAQLIWIEPGSEAQIESSVRFFLSPRSAYVSGQVVRVGKAGDGKVLAVTQVAPLTGKVALVTGASRGIGAAISEVLARDGAKVICLDVPAASAALDEQASKIGGKTLALDITDEKAPGIIADFVKEHFGGIDLVVHNAGITRDKTLGRMPDHFWDLTIAVNLTAEEHIDAELLERGLLRSNGRIVCVSSISGIAGNFGQTNYSTSKCGVIGYVEAMARQLKDGITINAVAPGFIETQMTAAIPLGIREAGRRMNSLSQGGQPVDVAETIAYFCHPQSQGVNGNVVRVCGQSLIGK